MKKYSKMKAMYLKKCFDNNETPIAGPQVSDEVPNFGALNLKDNYESYVPHVEQPVVPSPSVSPKVPSSTAAAAAASPRKRAFILKS
jgi:hypothetical protein